MNISVKNEDIFAGNAEALVNPVNCVGVMGGGLAKVFKDKYPIMFAMYRKACERNELSLGKGYTWPTQTDNPKWILNAPTKIHYANNSSAALLEAALAWIKDEIVRLEIKSIRIPALGCGLGGLNFDRDFYPLVEDGFLDESINCEVAILNK